ncbi:hypothetical protein HPP92_002480 [Vanilla planifolia]|uniref:GDSL esterase/lipase n=1 Tax=Vanilla planifolia TaxID=51239 RepID=A0A835S4G1_VANPL|nr:hypothetical protein HPP92_002480 [Vanilla planifolia]
MPISSQSVVILSILLLGSALFSRRTYAACSFRAIFNFGDSNSDTGGFWAAFPAQHGPFGITFFKRPTGRASDGRLAIGLPFLSPYLQSIGSSFKHGANFATLASTVLPPNTSLFISGISPFYLGVQLNQMKELRDKVLHMSSQANLPSHEIFRQALYTIDIGQNDFTSNLASIGIGGVEQYLPQVADQIEETIKELYDIGGRTFFIFNLAPVGCFPAFLKELPHNSSDLDEYGCMTSYNKAVEVYNELLNQTLLRTRPQLQDASVVYVDTYSAKLELYRHPKAYGLVHSTRACCGYGGGEYNFDPRLYCGNKKEINGRLVTAEACPDPENYVSWDGIHASDAANKLVALAILNGSFFYPPFPLSEQCDLHPIG